nr:hypothetical protein XNA1_1720034 [Xenorhabdus nematophila str. Anatoliense]
MISYMLINAHLKEFITNLKQYNRIILCILWSVRIMNGAFFYS